MQPEDKNVLPGPSKPDLTVGDWHGFCFFPREMQLSCAMQYTAYQWSFVMHRIEGRGPFRVVFSEFCCTCTKCVLVCAGSGHCNWTMISFVETPTVFAFQLLTGSPWCEQAWRRGNGRPVSIVCGVCDCWFFVYTFVEGEDCSKTPIHYTGCTEKWLFYFCVQLSVWRSLFINLFYESTVGSTVLVSLLQRVVLTG